MWLLSGLLVFVRLQRFAPSDAPLFKYPCYLALQMPCPSGVSASQTAFIGLKRKQFYLSHLPAYFSDIYKRTMLASLASPLVCADLLFAEADVARLLVDTQTSSSLQSQQVLVDVTSRSAGARRKRFSSARSPSCSSPSRQNKSVRFDSTAPS